MEGDGLTVCKGIYFWHVYTDVGFFSRKCCFVCLWRLPVSAGLLSERYQKPPLYTAATQTDPRGCREARVSSLYLL